MARAALIDTITGGLDPDLRRVLKQIFEYVLGNLRLGQPINQERAENLQAYFYDVVTPATPGTEFSIQHNLGIAPYLLLPVLPLQSVNAQIVPLRVTKLADANRIYLSSTVASASVTVLVEG